MTEEKKRSTLIEIINRAEKFCSGVEKALQDVAPIAEDKELRGKLGLCRAQMAYLRKLDEPGINNPLVRDGFRHLIIAMMWVAFYARTAIDFKLYRMLLTIEATFTYILMEEIPKYSRNGHGSHPHE